MDVPGLTKMDELENALKVIQGEIQSIGDASQHNTTSRHMVELESYIKSVLAKVQALEAQNQRITQNLRTLDTKIENIRRSM